MRHERRLQLDRRQPVPRDVHHVVDPAEQPEVAVVVPARAVAHEVRVRPVLGEVVGHVALVVVPERAEDPRPRLLQDEELALALWDLVALLVQDRRLDAGQRRGGGARLERSDSRQRADKDAAGLRLPPGVHHRAALAADVLPVPEPRLRVDRLADRAEQLQRAQVVPLHRLRTGLDERPDQSRRRVVLRDLVLLDDRPMAVDVRIGRVALIQHAGHAVGQRRVDDVAVSGHPADVGGAPPDVVVMDVEHVLVRERDVGEVAARGVLGGLGLCRRPRGVQQVEHVLRVHVLGLVVGRLALHHVVPPLVAPVLHRNVRARALEHHHLLDRRGALAGLVGDVLERNEPALTSGLVLGDHHAGARGVHALRERVGGEAAEHHDVRRSDPRAGEHRDRKLGHHAHVDPDAVALLHSKLEQPVGEAAHLVLQLRIADRPRLLLDRLGHEVVGHLVAAARGHVLVQAVV